MDQALEYNSELVDRFLERASHAYQSEYDELTRIGQDGLPLFEANVQAWLGSMASEITNVEDAVFKLIPHGFSLRGAIIFSQAFTWNGCEGQITSSPWGKPWHQFSRPAAWLKLRVPGSNRDVFSIKLASDTPDPFNGDGSYKETAVPVDENILGKFLLEIIQEMDIVHKAQIARREAERFSLLSKMENLFSKKDDIPAVQQYLAEVCQVEPNELARWNAAAKRRTLEIEAQQSKEREARELAELEESEHQRLADMAADLFHPFTVYKLSIAVYFPDEQETRLFHAFVTTSTPDEAGWFVRVQRGQLIPHYRPDSPVVDVTRIDIESASHPDAPEVCGHVELMSEQLPYISEYALSTPEGLE